MQNRKSFFKVKLLFYLTLLTLFNCDSLDKKYENVFPEKTVAKQTKTLEQQTWEQIQTQKSKTFEMKIKDIKSFIEANKDKEIALKAYLLKAQIFSKNKKHNKACLSYHEVVESPFNYTNQWKAYKASAKCYFDHGKLEKALEVLEQFIQNSKENLKDKQVSAKLQWEFLKTSKGLLTWKLRSLSHLFVLSPHLKTKQIWQRKGENLIDSLNARELISYSKQVSFLGFFEGYLLYKVGEHFWLNKKFNKAKNYFREALSAQLSLNLREFAEKKLRLIERISKVNPYLIGVVVPLSGRRKPLGEKVLRGLYMGLDMDKNSPWQIVVMDSKSHPDVVRAHLESLFYKHHVIGIVGGLTSETAEVIANAAEDFTTPAILFSQKKDLSLNRKFVFQNSITARQLLEPLVDELKNKLRVKKAAILYADDLYGKEYSALFSETFRKRGGEIVEYEVYRSGEVDFKKHIKKLLRLNIAGREKEFQKLKQKFLEENPSFSKRSNNLKPEDLLPVKKDFEAIFIPDSFNRLEKIKDYLKYFGIKDIYLLGTDLWQQSQVSSWTEDLPLIFVNLPEKNHSLLTKSSFYKEFIKSYIQPPGLFEQRAYNTGVFLKKALSRNAKSRLSLQKELNKIKAFQGAYYKISVSKDRVFNYPLNLYKTGFN